MTKQGFTIMELLVVIVIVGILGVIALPNFLRQADRARVTGAKEALRYTNQTQKIYYLENSGFAHTYEEWEFQPVAESYELTQPK